MGLSQGTRLGPYEIVVPLGASGMGEVYRARDARLERTVAIKVLNSSLNTSQDLRSRFEREAKVISQLQHPYICVLHDVGREADTDFLVMEFLEGESLADPSAGAIIGTVQYMSAEQIAGKEADARSVIFAFGTMLYEMAIWFAKHSIGRKGLKTDAI